MLGIFKKRSEKEKLQQKYRRLMKASYHLSHSNRKASDEKAAEAHEILKKIESL